MGISNGDLHFQYADEDIKDVKLSASPPCVSDSSIGLNILILTVMTVYAYQVTLAYEKLSLLKDQRLKRTLKAVFYIPLTILYSFQYLVLACVVFYSYRNFFNTTIRTHRAEPTVEDIESISVSTVQVPPVEKIKMREMEQENEHHRMQESVTTLHFENELEMKT